MIFTHSYRDGDHGTISDLVLDGYRYKGKPVELWVTRYSGYSSHDEYSASIRAKDNECTEIAHCGSKRSLYTALNWARNNLDGKPHQFGETDLRHKKALSSIKGEGAEYYIAGYLMMEFGYIVSLASPNMPSYDLLAVNPMNNKICKLQVKFRSDANSTLSINNFDFDFLVLLDKPHHEYVHVKLSNKEKSRPVAKFNVWVIDKDWVKSDCDAYGYLKNPRYSNYLHNWEQVVSFLSSTKNSSHSPH